MNTTDQALLLFRNLRWYGNPKADRLCYRAYLRWKRRQVREAGTITPMSVMARQAMRQEG